MSFLDGIRSYFREDEQTLPEQAAELDHQRRDDRFGDLPEEIEKMPPEDVADEFARMDQQTRLDFIQNGFISREKWTDMITMVKNNPKQRDFWGFEGKQTGKKGGTNICACHEEVTRTWTVSKERQKTIGQTQGTSETSKTESGVKMGGSGGVGVPGVGNVKTTGEGSAKKGWTHGETQQEMAQAADTMSRTQTIHSCRIEPTNSTLSRQAFLETGNIYIGQQYDKSESGNDLIDDWEMDADRTAGQEKPQKEIGELREERGEIVDQIEDLDGELETYDNRIEWNDEAISQIENDMMESEVDIDANAFDKRDELLEQLEEFEKKRKKKRNEKQQLQEQKNDLQGRIKGHEEYEEEADTAESTSQDAEETTTEETTAENEDEVAEESTDSAVAETGADGEADTEREGTTQTDTSNRTTDDPPESDGPPADDGGDRGGERDTDTVEESPTIEPDTEPAQATADAATDESDQSESDSTDATDQTDESAATEDQRKYDNNGERYIDRFGSSNSGTGGFNNSK